VILGWIGKRGLVGKGGRLGGCDSGMTGYVSFRDDWVGVIRWVVG
jgi:hypothetical protein